MSKQIKTITDKNIFEQICNKFFKDNNVYLKTQNGDLAIKFFGYSDGIAAFKVPYIKNITENCLIFVRRGSDTIHAHVKFHDKQEDDMFLFYVENFQIINIERREERKSVEGEGSKEGKEIIFVTNVISDFIIQNTLGIHVKKVDSIKETIKYEVGNAFQKIKIFFCNEGASDVRMKYFQDAREVIFIPNIQDKETGNKKLNFYVNNIYGRDYSLQNKRELISEISVPLMYKMKLPYGYIQANHSVQLTESSLSIVKRIAIMIDEMFNRDKIFPQSNDKFLVSNLAKSGFGIVFKDRKFIRYFKEDCHVYLDVLLPDNKRASILSVVKNITILENKVIRVGFQIDDIDALSEVHYEEYVESFSSSSE